MKRYIVYISFGIGMFLLTVVSICIFSTSLSKKLIYMIPQSTILLDNEGNELYRFFEQDRTRVKYDDIAPSMISAIIATEDNSFWGNNGIDIFSIARAALYNLKNYYHDISGIQGGSTITQQVVKNIYLSNERTLPRKIKELIISVYLTSRRTIDNYKNGSLTYQQAKIATKKEILGAYLNIIYYGNHSYGIQSAANHYFKKDAKNLSVIESAILASLPQSPSIYNPVRNPNFVMGYWEQTDVNEGSPQIIPYGKLETIQIVGENLENSTTIDECLEYITDLGGYLLPGYRYISGRKDRVLCSMVKLGSLSLNELSQSFIDTTDIELYPATFAIQFPQFVFLVQDSLEEIPYFKEKKLTYQEIIRSGYILHTTIDPQNQVIAQESIDNYKKLLQSSGGNNRAMIHIDSRSGGIKSYIGSQDYYDESIDGNVDVLRAIRQVGSTLKPFLYANLFTHYPYTPTGTVVDYKVSGMSVSNHDGLFWGKMTIGRALVASRNIPAVRVFYALGGSKVVSPYLRKLGFKDLQEDHEYSYPLVLGANEMRLTQLAQAYIQLSTEGDSYPLITQIEKIQNPSGKIVYRNPGSIYEKDIPDTVGQMVWQMLSDTSLLPFNRRWLRSMGLQNFAMKTGTSDRKVNGTPFPRDALSVIYTPEDVIVMWAGNTDGSVLGPKAYGGETNFYPLRQYITTLSKQGDIVDRNRILKNPEYTQEGFYSGIDHDDLSEEQEQWLWKL